MAKKLLHCCIGAYARVHMHFGAFLRRVSMHSQEMLSKIHVQVFTLHRCCEHQRTHLLHARYRMCMCAIYIHVNMHICMYIFIRMHVYIYTYVCIYMHMRTCMDVYICVCVCARVCVYICIYMYVCIYISLSLYCMYVQFVSSSIGE